MIWLLLGPALASLWYVIQFHLPFPVADQWSLAANIDSFNFHYLWQSFSVHRMFFPKLAFALLARVSHWNILWEVLANWAVFTAYVFFLNQALKRRDLVITGLLAVYFSPLNYQNLIWGFQLDYNLAALFSVGALSLAAGLPDRFANKSLALAALAALLVLAAYSQMPGLAAVLVVCLLAGYHWHRRRLASFYFGVLVTAALAITVIYFIGLQPEPGAVGFGLTGILKLPIYLLIYAGGIFTTARVGGGQVLTLAAEAGSLFVGCGLLAGLFYNAGDIARRLKEGIDQGRLFALALIAFSLLTGLLIYLGRSEMGLSSALTSRYKIFGMLFALGAVYLIAGGRSPAWLSGRAKLVKLGLTAALAGLLLFNWLVGLAIGAKWGEKYRVIGRWMRTGDRAVLRSAPRNYFGNLPAKKLESVLAGLKHKRYTIFR
ncbi:MAG: hypothetical protein WC529_07050 [Candidatus Margulisiibacteriota bacterium]